MSKKTFTIYCFLLLSLTAFNQKASPLFRVRTITAGVTLSSLFDTVTLNKAVSFLKKAKAEFVNKGYEVQTLRISTQNFYLLLKESSRSDAIAKLVIIDNIAKRNNISVAIGQILAPDEYETSIAEWSMQLVQSTSNISFSLPISSHSKGIHFNSIKASTEIISALSKIDNGEANFRFAATANCPPGIPFFPAAYHEGLNSFAFGLEFPKLLTDAFKQDNNFATARKTLKTRLEKEFLPVQHIGETISENEGWQYDGIDVSPAPGLDASIGEAIEVYTGQSFGSAATLGACAMITDVLKSLDIKKCGYSGLMLPVIEDKILAKRASEKMFTVQEILLYSSVSGTGLDVVPISGNTSQKVIFNLLVDVASLSLKYTSKALSVRLFLIPGKNEGDTVNFSNPYLTSSVVMGIH